MSNAAHNGWLLYSTTIEVPGREPATCLRVVEAYAALLVFTSATLLIKRYFFRPVLESHLKKKYAERLRSRRRRLQELLCDQMLLAGLERELERRYNGDKRRVMTDLENLRLLAETDVIEEHDNTKGDEKHQAAYVLLIGTSMLSVVVLLSLALCNLILHMGMDFDSAVTIQLRQDLCGDMQTVDVFLPYATYAFLLVHFVDSGAMVAMLPGARMKRLVTECTVVDVEKSQHL
ncbi:hypothetical protein MHU86_3750 [Fragilaria crotonensis]|nr:hypothetical protein MHU86_3750 [Fragilaria crotonensis]